MQTRRYLDRILKYSSCSNECFVLGLIYMDRFIQRNDFALTALNVHRVAITSVMVAAKFFDDQYYNNAYYAKVHMPRLHRRLAFPPQGEVILVAPPQPSGAAEPRGLTLFPPLAAVWHVNRCR